MSVAKGAVVVEEAIGQIEGIEAIEGTEGIEVIEGIEGIEVIEVTGAIEVTEVTEVTGEIEETMIMTAALYETQDPLHLHVVAPLADPNIEVRHQDATLIPISLVGEIAIE